MVSRLTFDWRGRNSFAEPAGVLQVFNRLHSRFGLLPAAAEKALEEEALAEGEGGEGHGCSRAALRVTHPERALARFAGSFFEILSARASRASLRQEV